VRAHFHHWGDEDRLELELFVAQWPFNSSVEKVEEASVVSSLEWFPRGYWTATLFSHEQYCDKITAPKLLSNAHIMRIGGVDDHGNRPPFDANITLTFHFYVII
jgi:hypothetical protein